MKVRLAFLRDDDLAAPDPRFRRVFELCVGLRLPVSYAVVPGRLRPQLPRWLRARRAPRALYDLVQHGWTHSVRSRRGEPRGEFPPSRPYALQRADMERGRAAMRRAFGPLFTPAFVPPYHRFGADTLRAAAELGLRGFSAGAPRLPVLPRSLRWLPAQVGVNRYDDRYRVLPLDLDALTAATARSLRSAPVTGIYFHHAALGRGDWEAFVRYCGFLRRLADTGGVRFVRMRDLL
ncbi:MAG: DUF2334 domain-containing protein [Elusimicrobiota bacterium]|jgi:peptidoglycan/xylan/chitin deacetylase (PgdA/CDA1 family)